MWIGVASVTGLISSFFMICLFSSLATIVMGDSIGVESGVTRAPDGSIGSISGVAYGFLMFAAVCTCALSLFGLCWLILGSVWVYPHVDARRCPHEVYSFAYVPAPLSTTGALLVFRPAPARHAAPHTVLLCCCAVGTIAHCGGSVLSCFSSLSSQRVVSLSVSRKRYPTLSLHPRITIRRNQMAPLAQNNTPSHGSISSR